GEQARDLRQLLRAADKAGERGRQGGAGRSRGAAGGLATRPPGGPLGSRWRGRLARRGFRDLGLAGGEPAGQDVLVQAPAGRAGRGVEAALQGIAQLLVLAQGLVALALQG